MTYSPHHLSVKILPPRPFLPTHHDVPYLDNPAAYLGAVLEYLTDNAPTGFQNPQERRFVFYVEAVRGLSAHPLSGSKQACLEHYLKWLPDVRPTRVLDATPRDLCRSTLAALGFARDFARNGTKAHMIDDWSEFADAAIATYRQRAAVPA